jgi:hypothetical protein
MLVAELDGRESRVDHRHEGLAVLLLERELDLGVEARSVQAGLRRTQDEAPRAIDHLEDVPVAVELGSRRPEHHGPRAADAQIALRLHDPARIVLPVEGLLAAGFGEGVQHLLGRRVDHARESQVVSHPLPALRSST